jgi:pentatricopeptide repeat protein
MQNDTFAAGRLSDWAEAAESIGQFEKAEGALLRAADFFAKDPEKTADHFRTLNKLVECYLKEKKLDEAAEVCESIKVSHPKEDNVELAENLLDIINAYVERDDSAKATELLTRYLPRIKNAVNSETVKTISARTLALAQKFLSKKMLTQAKSLAEWTLTMQKEKGLDGPSSKKIAQNIIANCASRKAH